jgi:formylglycine-generating enzyme required for sulfatase activity
MAIRSQEGAQTLKIEVLLHGYKTAERTFALPLRSSEAWRATLERQPFPQPGQPWENTLGMKFVQVPGTKVLFAIWDTRVQDFAAFVKASGYDASAGMYSLGRDGYKQLGKSWRDPGFSQGSTNPVCGVSWHDSKAFCAWLTEKERREGRLGPDQGYRLPTDEEWSLAVGLDEPRGGTPEGRSLQIKGVYPWGRQWPPPAGAGNYAGREVRESAWPRDWSAIDAYADDYPRTSPAGSFAANRFGLFDMGGNVWQWCEDRFSSGTDWRVLRGGAYNSNLAGDLLSSNRNTNDPAKRYDFEGFRCVLTP